MSGNLHKIVTKYRVFCTTDSKFVETDYRSSLPTTCPENNTHTISTVQEVDTISTDMVSIREEDIFTNGNYFTWGQYFTAPANSTYDHTWVFQHPSTVLQVNFHTDASMTGDKVWVLVNPNTLVGTITADVTAGDTVINVSQTVIDNVYPGYQFVLTDGLNLDDPGYIVAKDTVNNTVTINNPVTNNYLAASPTYVQIGRYYIWDMKFGPPGVHLVGDGKIGGTYIPAGTTALVRYQNNGGSPKDITFDVEMLI